MGFLKARNIRLRAVEYDDIDLILRVENDSSQWSVNGITAPLSRAVVEQYVTNYKADPFVENQLRLIAESTDPNTGEVSTVGIADLYDISAQCSTAWIGLYVLPDYRGSGVAAMVLRLLEDYARRLLNLRMLGAKVSEVNDASMHLFASAGYEKSGILPKWLRTGADYYDMYLFTKDLAF